MLARVVIIKIITIIIMLVMYSSQKVQQPNKAAVTTVCMCAMALNNKYQKI